MKKIFLLPVLVIFIPSFLSAQTIPIEEREVLLTRISSYFSTLGKLKTDIVQRNPDGTQETGTLYLDLPGRLRLDYHPPSPITIIATGVRFFLVDYALKETVSVPENRTPIASILKKDLDFLDPNLIILGMSRSEEEIILQFSEKRFQDEGHVVLFFQENPIALKKWAVVDAFEQKVEVELVQINQKGPFPKNDFFTLKNIWENRP